MSPLDLALLLVLAALQLADIITTLRVLAQGGRELNPLLAALITRFGARPVLIAWKLAVIAAVVWALRQGQMPLPVLIALDVLYLVVVVNNRRQIKS